MMHAPVMAANGVALFALHRLRRRGSLRLANRPDDDVLDGDIIVAPARPRLDLLDLVDDIHALDHLAENAVPPALILVFVIEAGVVLDVDVELRRRAMRIVGPRHGDGAAV